MTSEQHESEGMSFTSLHIKNFRGLRDVEMPLSNFGCLIGENNSGKSSALHALLLLIPGSGARKATADDFYDKTVPVRIALKIENIGEQDIERLAEAHRNSVANDVVDGCLTLVRTITLDGDSVKSELNAERRGPKNDVWMVENLRPHMKGKQKAELRKTVIDLIPDLDSHLPPEPTQTKVVEALAMLVAALPDEELVVRDGPLATGIENGLKGLLPEPIYIPAVKDLADEVKTTDSATFGKLLGILLEEVQEEFEDIEDRFKQIQRQLSRVTDPSSGVVVDDRLDQVRSVEKTINNFLRESFPEVDLKLEVPVPKMKTILAGAEISADDGYEGPVTGKGDGLKRAVLFAILRTYTSLRGGGIEKRDAPRDAPRYWLLFEEPELYLYPRAQMQLFRALREFAREHLVLVSTHSPLFFDADATRSFIKFRKGPSEDSLPPQTIVDPVRVDDLAEKKALEIICHENNNIGFFAKEVVLVEGHSDVLVLKHVARLLGGDAWDPVEQNIDFASIDGKGNIASYRLFFDKFKMPVHVVADLDVLLNGFEKLDPTKEVGELRTKLLAKLDASLPSDGEIQLTEAEAKGMARSGDARALWEAVKRAREALDNSDEARQNFERAVEEFFAYSRKSERLEALGSAVGEVRGLRDELISKLRESRVYVLSRGSIETYYGGSRHPRDKVAGALEFTRGCSTQEQLRNRLGDDAGEVEIELREIFKSVFGVPGT
ncbi:MAG: hypothetical protein CVT64_02720 [Actinobacteria bacterium HGW-Actinobacteria-4]|nr:MAG: hypothetical protein CVT64_02720 [Actinobacteria bacterium HGW-Actinobacteria-4]